MAIDDILFHRLFRQQIKIKQLEDDNESLKLRLKTTEATIERQIKQIETITVQLGESESALNEKEEDLEDLYKKMKNEVSSLDLILIGSNFME